MICNNAGKACARNPHAMNCRSRILNCVLAGVGLTALGLDGRAIAADLPVKAPAYDWTGFYVGGHIGYATGTTDWTATQAGSAIPTLGGGFDLFNSYNMFKGTGSY